MQVMLHTDQCIIHVIHITVTYTPQYTRLLLVITVLLTISYVLFVLRNMALTYRRKGTLVYIVRYPRLYSIEVVLPTGLRQHTVMPYLLTILN